MERRHWEEEGANWRQHNKRKLTDSASVWKDKTTDQKRRQLQQLQQLQQMQHMHKMLQMRQMHQMQQLQQLQIQKINVDRKIIACWKEGGLNDSLERR